MMMIIIIMIIIIITIIIGKRNFKNITIFTYEYLQVKVKKI